MYVLEIKPLSVASFSNIFSQSIGCLFLLFMVSFTVQKFVSLIRSYFFFTFFLIKNNYLFMAVLALCCCGAFFLVVMSRGFSLVAVWAFHFSGSS